jgi:hypothetical protein
MTAIIDIVGREVLDSRGNHEAVELRDGGGRYMGKGVEKAVAAVNGALRDNICGMDAEGQIALDKAMIALDGTANKSKLGANAISASRWRQPAPLPSRAACRSTAMSAVPTRLLPVPMMNIINGGAHADNPIDFQEFMIMPVGADIRRRRPDGCRGLPHAQEGTGGRRPQYQCRRRGRLCAQSQERANEALDFIMKSIEKAGYKPGEDIYLALDCAATEFFKTASTIWKARGVASRRKPWPPISPNSWAIRSSRSRTAWRRRLGRLEGADRPDRRQVPAGRRRPVRHQLRAPARRHQDGRRQFDPGQGQPDRHADRDARCGRDGAQGALHAVMSPPLRRDRGFDHRRSGGRHQLRTDQDRLAVALRPACQIQPAHPHRGRTRRPRRLKSVGPNCPNGLQR